VVLEVSLIATPTGVKKFTLFCSAGVGKLAVIGVADHVQLQSCVQEKKKPSQELQSCVEKEACSRTARNQ